jgi:hypothetical protein
MDFEQVRNLYKNTSPLVSNRFGKELNLRPIDRRKFYHHVYKFSNNCYAIYDGGAGDPLLDMCTPEGFRPWPRGSNPYLKPAGWIDGRTAKRFAPLLFKRFVRRGRVYEQVTIRNGCGKYRHDGRLRLLRDYLPYGLTMPFTNDGKQYVECQGQRYFLAKDTMAPPNVVKRGWSSFVKELKPYHPGSADRPSLVFERVDGDSWYYLKGGLTETVKRYRVDTKEKNKYKKYLKDFSDHVFTVYALMTQGKRSWDFRQEVYEEFATLRNVQTSRDPFNASYIPLWRQALKDTNHEAYLCLVKLVCYRTKMLRERSVVEDSMKSLRASINASVNVLLGFTRTIEEERKQ